MAGRQSDRTKRRTPCSFTLNGRKQNAFVLDLSSSGLFIQTSADASPGDRLDIEVVIDDKVLPMHVEVARRKKVPPQLLTVAHGGIGVRILSAPEGYYEALTAINGPSRDVRGGAAARRRQTEAGRRATSRVAGGSVSGPTPERVSRPAPPPEPELPTFRVRVAQVQGARTRSIQVAARDESGARKKVMEDLGDEWKILEITRLSKPG
jgi:hypothetical protein